MPRPPKKMNPGSHRSRQAAGDGRIFRKGRFANTPAPADESDTRIVSVGGDDTETRNASFAPADEQRFTREATPLSDRTVTSKYDARPSSGSVPEADEAREDVVIDLTDDGRLERRVVVDLTKLPAVDVSKRSDTVYIRHSAGWRLLSATTPTTM